MHYNDVIMGAMASQITSLTIVYSTVYSVEDQRKHQSSASLAFVWGSHRRPVNSPHKGPVTRKLFPFDDVIMWEECSTGSLSDPYSRTKGAYRQGNSLERNAALSKIHNQPAYKHDKWASNTLKLKRNGWHFANEIFKWIYWIKLFETIQISLNFVPNDTKSTLFKAMAWHRIGDKSLHDKPLPEPILTKFYNTIWYH